MDWVNNARFVEPLSNGASVYRFTAATLTRFESRHAHGAWSLKNFQEP